MKRSAFSIIELMIVVVILGILAAIAVPLYSGMVAQSRSADGSAALSQLKAKQEVFRSTHFRYASTLTDLPGYDADPFNYGTHYQVTIENATNTTFRAVAADRQKAIGGKEPGDDVWFINETTKDPVHQSKGW
ncbi:MAG: prepilin-type N-terminal cleavage/methylation domain-containing protein [Acidobacteria bacterium]|nr:prepilin-type N-terminal cleavage/methylation domain-containing protein [Acidobacteriota bacterium]